MAGLTKLLHKPIKAISWFAFLVLVASIPVYVLVTERIYLAELDESNLNEFKRIRAYLIQNATSIDELNQYIETLNALQIGIAIHKTETVCTALPIVFEQFLPIHENNTVEFERFRCVQGCVDVYGSTLEITLLKSAEEPHETFTAIALITLLFFGLLVSGILWVNRQIAKKTWTPFYQLLQALQEFKLGQQKSIQLPHTTIQEFHELNTAVGALIHENIAVFEQQKTFIENASHELQTPIAVLLAKLDVLLQNSEFVDSNHLLFNEIEAPLKRLARINKNLLLLAKLDHQQFEFNDTVEIVDVGQHALLLFDDFIQQKKLHVSTQLHPLCVTQINKFLLETLLYNLLSNAIRHTPNMGQIVFESHQNSIVVKNSGTEALNVQHLFERFASVENHKVSSGLGLAIVQEISKTSNWQVSYTFHEGFHVFTLIFK